MMIEKMKEEIEKYLEKNCAGYYHISDSIWEFAELAYQEKKTSQLQAEFLEQSGFHTQQNAGGIPNAIVAQWGSGKPIIGIFGEMDALPNSSQMADATQPQPLQNLTSGHACGHHLLGTASMAAADALRHVMEENGLSGTIRYYGCPAEEYGSGKVHMARQGLFDDLDIALSWHPYQYNALGNKGWLCTLMIRYVFNGITANPAHSAHLGRSALDAAELMGVGTQYLREHVRDSVRIHYAYQNSGGVAANVIPSKTEVNYFIRATTVEEAMEVKERVDQIAQGAAMMTGTNVKGYLHNALANYQENSVVDNVLMRNLQQIPFPEYSMEEINYGQLFKTVTSDSNINSFGKTLTEKAGLRGEKLTHELQKPVSDIILMDSPPAYGSTDFGDVSQIVPSGHLLVACYTIGAVCHSWQACAQGKSGIAHKGELYAAKVLAATGIDFLMNPQLVSDAQKEFLNIRNGSVYRCVIPEEIGPHGYEF